MKKSKSCVFCDIVKGDSASYRIYDDAHVFCFLDHDPINEGHILIVPKQHIANLDECSETLQMALMRTAVMMSRILNNAYEPEGISVMQNGGSFDENGHIHMHVFPRYANDGFGWVCDSVVAMSPTAQADRQALLMQAAHQYFKSTPQDKE